MPILFYGTKEIPYGCFSNFSAHPFALDNQKWRTSEHYFQAMKFYPHWEHIAAIRNMPSPMQAAKAGHSRARPLREDWEAVKDDIMCRASCWARGAAACSGTILQPWPEPSRCIWRTTDLSQGCSSACLRHR